MAGGRDDNHRIKEGADGKFSRLRWHCKNPGFSRGQPARHELCNDQRSRHCGLSFVPVECNGRNPRGCHRNGKDDSPPQRSPDLASSQQRICGRARHVFGHEAHMDCTGQDGQWGRNPPHHGQDAKAFDFERCHRLRVPTRIGTDGKQHRDTERGHPSGAALCHCQHDQRRFDRKKRLERRGCRARMSRGHEKERSLGTQRRCGNLRAGDPDHLRQTKDSLEEKRFRTIAAHAHSLHEPVSRQ
mmetsp:Transcript_3166/g.8753  ORF Transcript_3166/g.8753 Transcript_3166/m.8753 type:complete len:243 (+) Transcript_3166:478-1206(+)